MYGNYRQAICLVILILVSPHAISADDLSSSEPLSVDMSTWRLDAQGKNPQKTDNAAPGEILRYQVNYSNTSDNTLRGIQALVPVPDNTVLLAIKTEKDLWASLDGKLFSTWPLKRKIKNSEGKIQEELVPLSDIRFVRWHIPQLAKKTSAVFHIDVKVVE